jgi:hypothetical protein
MNRHSKRGGQANGNGVDEMRRGATRPATLVAIVLCVGFAVAMFAIWPFQKPRSHHEKQTQPETAAQTETAKPETDTSTSGTEIPKPEAVSPISVAHRAVPLEPSTATPVSQANPAARQLMDDHVNSSASIQDHHVNSPANSPTPVQEDQSYDFSHDLKDETITFEAVNPGTQVAGRMTVTITGAFHGNRRSDGESPGGSHLQADQQATFSFVPYYSYSPSYSATVKQLRVIGDTTNDSIFFDFGVTTTGSDGSSQRFMLREAVTVTEDGAQVTFEQR